MIYTFSNKALEIKVNTKGAELISLLYKGKELLWQANEPWKRTAPILFPIVGKLKNNQYRYLNTIYTLEQHGFARDKEWLCTSLNAKQGKIQFELTDDEETFSKYPFRFSLISEYSFIDDNSIKIHFKVFNPHYNVLPFSIGLHPAFNTFNDLDNCRVFFKGHSIPLPLKRTLLKDGLLSDEKEIISDEPTIKLQTCLFENDAIVLENTGINEMILSNKHWNYQISIKSDCKHWGIWTKAKYLDFVCIEPWMGIADTINTNGDILNKKDIILLQAYQSFEWSVEIRVLKSM